MIIAHQELPEIRRLHNNEAIVYAGGTFDLLHDKHLEFLSKLKEFGEIAVVGVSPDERVKIYKGPRRPIRTECQRIAVVDALKFVDYSFIRPAEAPGYKFIGHKILENLKPDVVVTSHESWLKDKPLLNKLGVKLELIPRLSDEISTTQTIEKIITLYSPSNNGQG